MPQFSANGGYTTLQKSGYSTLTEAIQLIYLDHKVLFNTEFVIPHGNTLTENQALHSVSAAALRNW